MDFNIRISIKIIKDMFSIKKNNNLIKNIIKYINSDVKLKSSFYHPKRISNYKYSYHIKLNNM
jgi:hypothetical protein